MNLTKKQMRLYLLIGAIFLIFMAVFLYVEQRNASGGYPQLFYDGRYYTAPYEVEYVLPEGYIRCGVVTEELRALKKPKRHGQCNWLPAGSSIYKNPAEPDALYVMTPNGRYMHFTIRT